MWYLTTNLRVNEKKSLPLSKLYCNFYIKGSFLAALKRPFDKNSESPEQTELFSSPIEQKQYPKEAELFSRSTKISEEPNIVENKSSSQNRLISNVALRVQCPQCNVDMREESLPRHRKTKQH